ncbi:hypothetical protein PRIPAC_72520 [Pristionchus pacificus]|uniref:Uncharacterized protein n=1 Tax=Pristionchus pacificus TaxID=54126 RepID=A0A2A6BGI9_PRIPA|nr:hypothetical protein PRIPAC_72520 [Pristionchus pacificus]|eukprot:PDM65035.1 hypothetical protein PRIPAC_53291 [Pristionchus pacificus]
MNPTTQGVSATGRDESREGEPCLAQSPFRKEPVSRDDKDLMDSPNKLSQDAAEAKPVAVRALFSQPLEKEIPLMNNCRMLTDSDGSPSHRITEKIDSEDSSSMRYDDSITATRKRPSTSTTSHKWGMTAIKMEPTYDYSENALFDNCVGQRTVKKESTEPTGSSHGQSRYLELSRALSDVKREQQMYHIESIEELTVSMMDEYANEEVFDDVAHEEMVYAVSPDGNYIEEHQTTPHNSVMGESRRRGMHLVSDNDNDMDHQLEGEEHGIEEIDEIYDEDGNMMMQYEGEGMIRNETVKSEKEIIIYDDSKEEQTFQLRDIKKEELRPMDDEEEEVEDDDEPPQLEAEEGPEEEVVIPRTIQLEHILKMENYGPYDMPVQSPGGTQYVPATEGIEHIHSDTTNYSSIYSSMSFSDDEMYLNDMDPSMVQIIDADPSTDVRDLEWNFLDRKNVCCGICGEIVPYDELTSIHIPLHHPEVRHRGLEEVKYDEWLKGKLEEERKGMDTGFRPLASHLYVPTNNGTNLMHQFDPPTPRRNNYVSRPPLRRLSQYRAHTEQMTVDQLEVVLRKKMVEKMGRRVKVSLVDKAHARCGICNAVVSLNKKFEIIHLVRHFNAWHPSVHRCAGTWPHSVRLTGPGNPLTNQDFSIVDVSLEAPEALQCIWCGMFMDRTMLAMHFHEVHPDDVEVPKCHLCLQEVVINARLHEKHQQSFEIILPDEHHIKSLKLKGLTFTTEAAMDRYIDRKMMRMQAVAEGDDPNEIMTEEEDGDIIHDDMISRSGDYPTPRMELNSKQSQYSNSSMTLGRRNKPKRNFVMPRLRQAIPQDSEYVEALSEGEWRCKLCGLGILAAVISAGAIKHFRKAHPNELANLQFELCKTRLERISDGCMEFVHPQMVECLICHITLPLHKPYNMCRGIRHLKMKHQENMPEYREQEEVMPIVHPKRRKRKYRKTDKLEMGECIEDPIVIDKLKKDYDIDFEKVQPMYAPGVEPIFVLVSKGQEIDQQVTENIKASLLEQQNSVNDDMDSNDSDDDGDVIIEEEQYQMASDMIVRTADEVDDMTGESQYPRGNPNHLIMMDDVEEEEPIDVEEEIGVEEIVENEEHLEQYQ